MTNQTEPTTVYSISTEEEARLKRVFTYHRPDEDQTGRYETLRQQAYEMALSISTLTPKSREQSLALTKLEESIMHANAAIARNE